MIFDIQKARILKRLSAFILDAIIFSVLAVGFAYLLSVAVGYDKQSNKLADYRAYYEKEYNVDTAKPVDELTDEEIDRMNSANEAFRNNDDAVKTFMLVNNLMLVITTFGILFGISVTEFVIPLLFENGQTVGKKIFGIGIIRTNGVRITAVPLFIHAILGKYTIETMIPVLIFLMIYMNTIGLMGVVVLGALLLLQIGFFVATKNHIFIHDMLSDTVPVDMASQMIFDTEEDRLDYIKKKHAEKARCDSYD